MISPEKPPTSRAPRHRLALAVALGLMLLWGSNYSVQKAVMAQIGPGALVFMRYLVTPACAVALLLWRYGWRWPRLERRDWLGLLGLAALGHIAHVNVMTQAMHLSTAFSSALISALGPMFTLLLVRVLHSQRFTRLQVGGVVLAMVGVLVFLSDKFALMRTQGLGDLLLLLAALLFSAHTVAASRLFILNNIGDYATKKYSELRDTDPEEAAKWDEGGIYRSLAHAVVGGLTGGAAGAAGAGLAALSAEAINQLTEDMPDGVRNLVGVGIAAGIGAIAGGSAGAATAFNADVNNRQLHPNERALAKRLAQKSGGKYTAEEIENALRTAGNNKTGESVVAGMVVDPSLRDAIYDKGAVWTTGADGWLVQVLPPQPDADLSAFIKQNTGETYGWYTPSSGGMPSNSNAPRDRLTGQPLDEKGRYSQTVVLDGKAYEPKYHPCATAECIRTGVNLDMSDPDTQAYVKALDAQVFKGIGRGATLGIVAFSTGVVAATLGGVGLIASAGEAFTGSTLTDQSLNELSQRGGQWFFENVLRYPPAAATRSVAMIALAGGWDSFVARLKTDLFGVEN